MPNARPKLVVKDPTLRSPTVRQMSATVRSVLRSSAAARSSRRVRRYWCGVSPKERRNSRRLSIAAAFGSSSATMVSQMSEAETLFGEKHVQRYRETGGEVGHRWKRSSKILLLTTKGRKSGEPRTKPLIYEQDGDRYVIVASKGGAPAHPGWYLNLQKDPNVELQVLDEVFPARARTGEGEERERLWQLVNQQWPDYDSYQAKTDREIPVVVLERTSG